MYDITKLAKTGLKLFCNPLTVLLSTTLFIADRTMAESVVPVQKSEQNPSNTTNSQSYSSTQTDSNLKLIEQYSLSPTIPIAQVTSVSQLSDVQPADWAFQALQSLIDRYGCIAAYPNRTFRGNHAMTRYEFAAGLNACLDRVNELIATTTSDVVKKEDLMTLQHLQEEFAPELATLRGRVDALDARTAKLEAHQFSTTVTLKGEAIFSLSGFTGGSTTLRDGRDNTLSTNPQTSSNIVFSDRLRIVLNANFTHEDLLRIRFQPNNTISFAGKTLTGTNQARLGWDGDNSNTPVINQLFYCFPVFSKQSSESKQSSCTTKDLKSGGRIFIGAVSTPDDFLYTITPYDPNGMGAISRFGTRSPIYRIGSTNTSVGFAYNFRPWIQISGLYAVPAAYTIPKTSPKNGLFNSTFTATGQIFVKPAKNLDVALTYVHAYLPDGNLNTGTGSSLAENIGNSQPTNADSYGLEATWRMSRRFRFTGWVNYTAANQTSGKGAAESLNYMAFLGLRLPLETSKILKTEDVLDVSGAWDPKTNNFNELVFGFGQPPKLTGVQGAGVGRAERDTTYQIESFYNIHINKHLLITPGFFYIINPENNSTNKNIFVGVLRSTLTF
ncbi:iron uptake porin [Aetokthonos hydrillicola Thurmond2011]|jgi:hypothetical protein|uniref:Iron uptake porin n=1 Tax=Aetokthonos hydrillicola Thurmond2011 TaxID=2712845 RepID=A0AAP5I7L7_9CYAN|nr:iron uptake porin [Aetokthonos hydrillicola]MBO3458257.1 iron uptake porin [Aetokthonos hydrillicola CCALA 1050]MBW4586718.1 iron uptake porin [Aetokthonos hydrillicola CCALA 1050]MDR9893955.1 iron uptake porin [Aetokthonos hydrillicola Thurmond2011]